MEDTNRFQNFGSKITSIVQNVVRRVALYYVGIVLVVGVLVSVLLYEYPPAAITDTATKKGVVWQCVLIGGSAGLAVAMTAYFTKYI